MSQPKFCTTQDIDHLLYEIKRDHGVTVQVGYIEDPDARCRVFFNGLDVACRTYNEAVYFLSGVLYSLQKYGKQAK